MGYRAGRKPKLRLSRSEEYRTLVLIAVIAINGGAIIYHAAPLEFIARRCPGERGVIGDERVARQHLLRRFFCPQLLALVVQ